MSLLNRVKTNNPTAYTIIKNAIESKKVAHAYLFSAPKNTLIEDVPTFLAQSLINDDPFNNERLQSIDTYSDIQIIDGSSGLIKKEIVIKAAETLQQTTLDRRGVKILIIKNVESGNKQSLNSLLKFIEEPTPNTFIIMTTNNVSQVLSTIRSRAQVVNLRSIPFEQLVSQITEKGIDNRYIRALASISKNVDEAIGLFDTDFTDAYKEISKTMDEAKDKPDYLITSLSGLIKKGNLNVALPLLRTFINDIWKQQQGFKIAFNDANDIITSYKDIKFNFQEALIIINDFIVSQTWHVNFELYKSQMLIKLRRCYG